MSSLAISTLGSKNSRRTFNGRVQGPEIVENGLSPSLAELADTLRNNGRKLDDESQAQDFYSASDRLRSLAGELEHWRRQEMEEAVYWVERRYTRRSRPRMSLSAAPLEVGAALREQLFNETRSVILTSATLAVGKPPSFEFYQSRIGLAQAKTLRLGSPFDYREQAKLIVVRDMPDPQSQRQEFERQCVAMIQRYVAATEGRAFVLFTSYEMMRRTASQLTGWLVRNELSLYSQSDGLPRTQMIEKFRANPRSVLFGVDSFWQGVDVPGEALVNVIITKLPFSVPSEPLTEARLEAIKARGGNPFKEFQVPEAVIKLRQGFGRLIRSRQDTGQVVILDPRVVSRPYGRTFLNSLPECELIEDYVGSPARMGEG